MLSSGVLAESSVDYVHRHRTSWLLYCAPSSETIADSLSSPNGQLTFSGHVHVLLRLHLIHHFLVLIWSSHSLFYSIKLSTHQSIHSHIHPPIDTSTHSPIHPSIHQSTHPLTHIPTHIPPPTHMGE